MNLENKLEPAREQLEDLRALFERLAAEEKREEREEYLRMDALEKLMAVGTAQLSDKLLDMANALGTVIDMVDDIFD